MTGDELAAACIAQQGYLVMAYEYECKIREISKPIGIEGPIATPCIVIGTATKREFLKQRKLANQILGQERFSVTDTDWNYFYRVEAAD